MKVIAGNALYMYIHYNIAVSDLNGFFLIKQFVKFCIKNY